MNDSETYTFEDERRYINPTLSRDEQLDFVDTLRDTMHQNTTDIGTQTERLGTNIPSNLGGLTGSNSYFAQRYQTTPLENQVNTLKATAQAKALNDLLTNYETQMKNKAQQAYRGAARRSSYGSATGSSSGSDSGNQNTSDFQVEYVEPIAYDQSGALSVAWSEDNPSTHTIFRDGYSYTTDDSNGKLYYTNDPDYVVGGDGYYHYQSAAEQRKQNMSLVDRALFNALSIFGGI